MYALYRVDRTERSEHVTLHNHSGQAVAVLTTSVGRFREMANVYGRIASKRYTGPAVHQVTLAERTDAPPIHRKSRGKSVDVPVVIFTAIVSSVVTAFVLLVMQLV